MKKLILIISVLLLSAGPVLAQRGSKAAERVEDFRPLGEVRLWSFVHGDSLLGTLVSAVTARGEIDGVPSIVFKEELKLDYRKINSPLNMHIVSQHSVSNDGYYLADDMKLTINDKSEELLLERRGAELKGYMTRGGKKIDQKISFSPIGFAGESNFLDQYELFLGMRDFKVGDTIIDTVFMPQSMVPSVVRAVVEKYDYFQLYNDVYDSAFVIHYTEPQEQYHYFTPGKRLVKAVIPSQNIRVFLDMVRQTTPPQQRAQRPQQTLSGILSAYVIYFVVGLVAVALFIGGGYRWSVSYWGLVVGMLGFGVAFFTQIPLQMSLVKNVFAPNFSQGSSPYVWGILPALAAGIIQELLKVLGIAGLVRWRQAKAYQFIAVGATVGAGFGLVEAGYLAFRADASMLLGIGLLERLFVILFHVTSGAIVADSLATGYKRLAVWVGVAMAVNTLFRYLPLLAQTRMASPEMLAILLALMSVAFLAVVLLLFRKNSQQA